MITILCLVLALLAEDTELKELDIHRIWLIGIGFGLDTIWVINTILIIKTFY